MFVNYLGTKEKFIEKGYEELYKNQIVFIRDTDGNNGCIYTRNNYFADFQSLLKTISFVKGVKLGGSLYEVSKGGGYLSLSAKVHNLKNILDPTNENGEENTVAVPFEVVYDGNTSSIRFGLSDEFIKQINNIIDELLKIKGDYLTTKDIEDLETLIKGNVSEEFNTLEKIENKIKNLKGDIVAGDRIEITQDEETGKITISALSEIDDVTESEELTKKRTWSIDKIKSTIENYRLTEGNAVKIEEDNTVNVNVDGSSIMINDKNELTVCNIDGGLY